eukprot:9351765-Heterocapsa_arctica.AAC.1
MGWSWAVHVVQTIHMDILSRAELVDQWVVHKKASAVIGPGLFAGVLYIDNYAVFGVDPVACRAK